MFKTTHSWLKCAVAGAALLAGAFASDANAGSTNSSRTYAGDINGIALPDGTFVVIDYIGYAHGNEYINNAGVTIPKSSVTTATNVTRFVYITRFQSMPLALEAAIPYARVIDEQRGGVEESTKSGFFNPTIFVTLAPIADPKNERFLGFTNYLYFPVAAYDNQRIINVGAPNQYTWVPQVAYAEGLGKFIPGLKDFWIDVIANTSIHSDGSNPLTQGRLYFSDVKQDDAYNVKAFIRYNYTLGGFFALGVEKSWGSEQDYTGGNVAAGLAAQRFAAGGITPAGAAAFGAAQAAALGRISKADYLKGHIQATMPLSPDFFIGTDITHDFDREGGFSQDFTAELRLTKLFLPQREPLK